MAKARPGEFELIERYFRPLAGAGALDLGDDAALLKTQAGQELVLTADLVVAGVHFLPDDPAESVARKALRVNLSDLAAKGAEPVGYLLALALPGDWKESWVRKFSQGLQRDQATYGISLLGGDTSRAAGGLTIAITAIGRVPKGRMVHRSGARPGDFLFVSGTIGDAALGLQVRLGKREGGKFLVDRYLHPQPRTRLAEAVRKHASAAMDVSDGLVGDLKHICDASGAGAEIDVTALPLSPAAKRVLASDPAALATILSGGDDYEILCTVPPGRAGSFVRDAGVAGVPVTRIGRVTTARGAPVVLDGNGRPMRLDRISYDHFG